MKCVRCLVSGRVQGVWYRASTQLRARELGLTGRACNLPDGRVEVVACGDVTALEALCAWLWQGSELAQVDDVVIESCAHPGLDDFTTG